VQGRRAIGPEVAAGQRHARPAERAAQRRAAAAAAALVHRAAAAHEARQAPACDAPRRAGASRPARPASQAPPAHARRQARRHRSCRAILVRCQTAPLTASSAAAALPLQLWQRQQRRLIWSPWAGGRAGGAAAPLGACSEGTKSSPRAPSGAASSAAPGATCHWHSTCARAARQPRGTAPAHPRDNRSAARPRQAAPRLPAAAAGAPCGAPHPGCVNHRWGAEAPAHPGHTPAAMSCAT